MRNGLRALWVVGLVVVLAALIHQDSAAQQELRAPMPPNLFAIRKLTDRLFIIAPSGPDMSLVGGNIGVFVTDDGVLIVDDNYYRQRRNGQTVELAEAVAAEIRKLTDQPIRFVINTHHHADHAGGNPVFATFSTIYAHRNVRPRLIAGYQNAALAAPGAVAKAESAVADAKRSNDQRRLAEALEQLEAARMNQQAAQSFEPFEAAPTVTYDGELSFHMGGEEIVLYHPSRAHTDGDSLVHFKKANVALWGDAFANNWVPVIDAAGGGSTVEWLQFIDRGIQLVGENAVMVPGHGAVGTAADVRRLRLYFTTMQENVRKALTAGKTRQQAMDDITVPEYASLPGGASRIRMNVGAVYDELSGAP